jgi:hypothetical protein
MMKIPTQLNKIIAPPLISASVFALASWALFALTSSKPDATTLSRFNKLRLLQEEDHKRLGFYGWVDRAKGWVRIPISRALELEEQRLRAIPPHPSENSSPFAPVSLIETPP